MNVTENGKNRTVRVFGRPEDELSALRALAAPRYGKDCVSLLLKKQHSRSIVACRMRLLRWMRPLPNNPKQLPNEWLYWKNPVFPMLVWKHLWTKFDTGESVFLPSPIRAYGRKKRTGAVLRTTGTVLLAITTRKVV